MKKKIFSLILACVMLLSLLPAAAFADAVPVPPGAVAYVTDAKGEAVDAEGENEGDLGGGYYDSFKAAFKAVPEDSAKYTITMKADSFLTSPGSNQIGVEVKANQNIVLDLNGKNVYGYEIGSGDQGSCFIKNNGTLTIMDSSDVNCDGTGTGHLSYGVDKGWGWTKLPEHLGSYACNLITNYGKLTIESGYLVNTSTGGVANYAVDNYNNGKLTVNGGRLHTYKSSCIRQYDWGTNSSVAEINGGVVIANQYTAYQIQCTNNTKAKLTINGGEFYGNDTNLDVNINGKYALDVYPTGGFAENLSVTINGGTFHGDVYVYAPCVIKGGTFEGEVEAYNGEGPVIYEGYFDGLVSTYEGDEIVGGTFNNETNYCNQDVFMTGGKTYWEVNALTLDPTPVDVDSLISGMKAGDYAGHNIVCYSSESLYGQMETAYGGYELWRIADFTTYILHDELWKKDGQYYRATGTNTQKILTSDSYFATSSGNYPDTLQGWNDIGYDTQIMTGTEGIYFKYHLYGFGEVLYPDQIATGYFARDNEDGTYDVVKAVANLTYDYTDENPCQWDNFYEKITGAANQAVYAKTNSSWAAYDAHNFLIKLCDNSKETFTLPAGVTFMIPKYTSGANAGNAMYAFSGKVLAPDGYTVVHEEKTDGTYYTVIKEGQETAIEYTEDKVSMGGEQGEVFVPAIEVTGTKDNAVEGQAAVTLDETELKKAAVEAAEKITENKAVTEFKDVGINEALVSQSEAKDKEQKVDVKVDAVVVTKEKTMVETLTGKTESTDTTSYKQSFDVKPMVKSEAPENENDPNYKKDKDNQWWKIIPNDDIEGEITFRLPIESEIKDTLDTVFVTHEGYPDDSGFFPIQSETKGDKTYKFVELKASEFSVYTYEVMTSVSQNDLFAIPNGDGTYTGYETLDDLTTAIGNSTDKTAILLKDLKLGTGETYFEFGYAGEEGARIPTEFTLDLNGHTLKGASENSKKVTVINSDTENYALLQATGTYANDVKGLCSDGYDARTPEGEGAVENSEVYKPGNSDYEVVVEVTTGTDRVEGNDEVDVFAGDTVTVTVSVLGARYAAADITLTYDKDNFTVKSSPKSNWEKNLEAGTFRFYNAKKGGGYFEPGLVTNGTFTFTVKEGDAEVIKDMFTVSTSDTYIASAWASGWASDPAAKLDNSQITDDWANIRLKQMNASVTPNNGLSYKEIGQKLLADGYTASNALTGTVIDDATISYAILTKAEADGTVQMKDESGNLLFKDGDGYLVTEDTGTPAYEPAKAPAAEDYSTVQPTVTDAGDYTIFWKITRKGYIPVSGKENVSIAPLNVTLNWDMPGNIVVTPDGQKDGNKTAENSFEGNPVTTDYFGTYGVDGFAFTPGGKNLNAGTGDNLPAATAVRASVKALNVWRIADISMTGKPDVAGTNEFKAVGTYTFTADLGSNYNISNPTVTVLIDGGVIEGYSLEAINEITQVYYDGKDHTPAQKVVDGDATPEVTVKYCYSTDNGETFTGWEDAIPVLTNSNPFPYIVKMQLSKDSFYTQEKTFNFSIKPVQYYTEKTDYITGWDLVLCYTDEAVPSFNYDGNMMYDVTSFGYKLGDVWNPAGTEITEAGQSYAHVYAYLVEGNADTNKVLPSNVQLVTTEGATYVIDLNTDKGRMDVNKSGTIDINDLVAVQAVYNVDKPTLTGIGLAGAMADLSEQARMAIVLRADCSGNKIVDTYDCSLIKTNTGK